MSKSAANNPINGEAIWGVAIPGLAMAGAELPLIAGLERLDNPEIGLRAGPDGAWSDANYTLVAVAEMHARYVNSLNKQSLTIIGMSMGGMIVSIMASQFRELLPKDVSFRVLVSSPNLALNPAIPAAMLIEWQGAKPGQQADFERILTPFFSESFMRQFPNIAQEYFRYRALGENGQRPKALYRQIAAIASYDGSDFWPKIDPTEITIIGGGGDKILGPKHSNDLKMLLPQGSHKEIKGLGHMVNLEIPELFSKEIAI